MNWDWGSWWRDYMQSNPTWAQAKAGLDIGIAREQPNAVYTMWTAYQNGPRTFTDWLSGQQQQKYLNQYQAASLTNPTLQLQDYLDTVDPMRDYRTAPWSQRGEHPGMFAGRSRWVP